MEALVNKETSLLESKTRAESLMISSKGSADSEVLMISKTLEGSEMVLVLHLDKSFSKNRSNRKSDFNKLIIFCGTFSF